MTSNNYPVHTGWWYDHDIDKPLQGYRLTVTNTSARFLRTFLVMAVAFAGKRGWDFVSFLLYLYTANLRTKARKEEAESIREQQVVLRNLETAGGTFFYLLKLLFVRTKTAKTTKKVWMRIFILGIALSHYFAFIGFGFLTGFADVGDIVRARSSPTCGLWEVDRKKTSLRDAQVHIIVAEHNAKLDGMSYAENCVRMSDTGSKPECNMLYQNHLEYMTYTSTCEWDATACNSTQPDSAFVMESKNLSFSQLGFNTPFSSKIHIAIKRHCSPLLSYEFMYTSEMLDNSRSSVDLMNDFVSTGINKSHIIGYSHLNYISPEQVFVDYRFDDSFILTSEVLRGRDNCQNSSVTGLCPTKKGLLISVINLLRSRILFPRPLYDAFFYAPASSAMNTTFTTFGVEHSVIGYRMTRPINSVACTESTRYCSDITGECTPWTGTAGGDPDLMQYYDDNSTVIYDSLSKTLMGKKYDQHGSDYLGVMTLILHSLKDLNFARIIEMLGTGVLRAPRYAITNVQYAISDEQWKIELEWWFQIALATLHRAPLRMAHKPDISVGNMPVNLKPIKAKDSKNTTSTDEAAKAMWDSICTKVKFRSPNHTTFSTAGIAIVLAGLIFLTILSFIDLILEKWWPHAANSQLRSWKEDDVIALLEIKNFLMREHDDHSVDKNEICYREISLDGHAPYAVLCEED